MPSAKTGNFTFSFSVLMAFTNKHSPQKHNTMIVTKNIKLPIIHSPPSPPRPLGSNHGSGTAIGRTVFAFFHLEGSCDNDFLKTSFQG